jgi:antibiotic biosynthesis monooxygenase (ABM) superfamily enzyme
MASSTTHASHLLSAAPGAAAPAPTPPAAPATPPSVHVRAVVTWLAIFPLVSIGMLAMAPFAESWHPVLRALVLTLVVVPLAVYLVVPRLLRAHGRIAVARAARRAGRAD